MYKSIKIFLVYVLVDVTKFTHTPVGVQNPVGVSKHLSLGLLSTSPTLRRVPVLIRTGTSSDEWFGRGYVRLTPPYSELPYS